MKIEYPSIRQFQVTIRQVVCPDCSNIRFTKIFQKIYTRRLSPSKVWKIFCHLGLKHKGYTVQ